MVAFAAGCDRPARGSETSSDDAPGIYGISTSLPIVWPEVHDIADMLDPDRPGHWALAALRERGEVRPLDTLADETGALPLPAGAVLVLAQPYPFSPQEYVALDNWVRGGGRVLLFADPMLTFHSRFALGDRRRPQDIVKLDPILARWGLALTRDDDGTHGETTVEVGGVPIPVAEPGSFTATQLSPCRTSHDGLIAECAVEKGRVLAIADATLLEDGEPSQDADSRRAAFIALLARLTDTKSRAGR